MNAGVFDESLPDKSRGNRVQYKKEQYFFPCQYVLYWNCLIQCITVEQFNECLFQLSKYNQINQKNSLLSSITSSNKNEINIINNNC